MKVVYTLLLVLAILASIILIQPQQVRADAETLPPTGQIAWTNLDGDYTDIDDDPDSPDGNWADNITEDEDTIAHVSFDDPTGNLTTGAGLQEFQVWVRKTQAGGTDPECTIYLYESGNGGNPLATSSTDTITSEVGQMVTLSWDASLLTDVSGTDVELYIWGDASGGSPSNRRGVDIGAAEWNVTYSANDPPTVTTQAATNVEATTATGNGTITNTGGDNATRRGFEWDIDSGAPYANDVHEDGSFGAESYSLGLTSLPTGTTIYYRAYATNPNGTGYGGEQTFLTKPAAPTNVSATDGDHTDKVTVTWTKATGATGYDIYRDAGEIDTVGDVATYDDTGADAPTITPGTASATDGDSTSEVTLSLAGESANNGTTHTYKVVAFNATGDSVDSNTDNGYRGVGALTYQWQRSADDSDGGYGNIVGATTDPYSDTAAPAPTITTGTTSASDGSSPTAVVLSLAGESANVGDGRWYRCVLNATGASQQISTTNRGYMGVGALTYQWQRSADDSDAGYGDIVGATTDPYNDTAAPAPTITPGTTAATDGTSSSYSRLTVTGESGNNGEGRYYKCVLNATGAAEQTSPANRGYRGTTTLTYQWRRSSADADADYSNLAGATTDPYNDTSAAIDPDGRWYYCEVSMTGAVTQDTTHDRGYRSVAVGGTHWLPLPLIVPPLAKKLAQKIRNRKKRKVAQ